MTKPLQLFYVAVVLFGLGSGFGTFLHRVSRLPAWFWLPCVSATACLLSYTLFFIFFVDAEAGRSAAAIVWGISVTWFALAWRDARVRQTLRHRDAWLPALLTALLTAAYLASVLASDATINARFRFLLPGDNYLPRVLADWIAGGSYETRVAPTLMEGGWRMSDRPPLQASVVLATLPMLPADSFRFYDVTAILCQMGWLPALYALGRTIAMPGRYLRFALAAAASSPFFFFNSVYAWPKLLAAWLFITGLTLVLHVMRQRSEEPSPPSPWVLVGAGTTIALSLLAHGGIAFSVLALPLLGVYWVRWKVVRARPGVVIAAVAIVPLMNLPWTIYQAVVDPPGNRLIKQHLAGVVQLDERSTSQAFADAYRALDARAYVAGRWANVTQQWFGDYPLPVDHWIDWVQWQQLMRHLPLIGFLCVGYVMLVWTPARGDLPEPVLRVTRQLTWYAVVTALIWMVVMIVPASAMVHQGSYAMTMLLLFGAAVLTAMLPPAVRWAILSLHVSVFAACYFFSVRTASLTPVAWRPWTFVEAGMLFACFLVALGLVPDAPRVSPREGRRAAGFA